jgi:hypothetical protein
MLKVKSCFAYNIAPNSIKTNVAAEKPLILLCSRTYSRIATNKVVKLRITMTVGTLTYISANRLDVSIITNNKTNGIHNCKIVKLNGGKDPNLCRQN